LHLVELGNDVEQKVAFIMPKDTYTSGQVAELLGIPARTARRYLTTGKIPAQQNPITGTWKIGKDDLRKFMEKYQLDTSALTAPPKVLVVDDDATIVNLVVRSLEKSQYRFDIDSTTDGYEALIKVGKEAPSLVILDVQMPGTDGKQVLKVIKENEHTQSVRILVITGYPDYIDEMKALGADDGMAKPFKPFDLIEKIESMIPDLQLKGESAS